MAKKSKPKKKTKSELLYQKEYRNLLRRIRRLGKLGYYFEELTIPEKPTDKRKLKKAAKELYNLRGQKLKSYASARDYGDFRDSYEYEEDTDYQPVDTRVIDEIMDIIRSFDNEEKGVITYSKTEYQKNRMMQILNDTIASEGRENVARRLNEQGTASEIHEIVEEALNTYKKTEQDIDYDFNRFAELITGGALTPSEAQNYSNDNLY